MPTISVIVPVYNGEKYLHRCIDSILAQTYKDFELLLVDDGSTDNSKCICEEYATTDSRIKVLYQKNLGQAVARNYAIMNSTGEFISFVDADDFIHRRFLELCMYGIRVTNTNICCCGIYEGDDTRVFLNDVTNTRLEKIYINDTSLRDLFVSKEYLYGVVWGKIIRKEIVRRNIFTPGRIYEDSAVVCKWLCSTDYIIRVSHKLYAYCLNPESTIHRPFSLKRLDILWSLNQQLDLYSKIGYKTMIETIRHQFLLSAASCCKSLRDIGEEKYERRIKTELITRLIADWRIFCAYKEDRKYIIECLFPNLMNYYWTVCGALQKLKQCFKIK